MSEERAKEVLTKLDCLPKLPPDVKRVCWKCDGDMELKVWAECKTILRCKKCQLHFNGATAYTPLHLCSTTHKEYLQFLYAFSHQYRQDQTETLSFRLTGEKVTRFFACFRDIYAWYQLRLGRGVTFDTGEVDIDAAKTHVDRSDKLVNVHKGRLLVMRERATGKSKVIPLDNIEVGKGEALPPEANEEIQKVICATLKEGSIAGGDGGRALKSSVKKAAGGKVPLATAVHGRQPTKQFTRLQKFPKDTISPGLQKVLEKQGRWNPESSSIRVTGGNQGAESKWGTKNMNLKSRCLHRGKCVRHSSSHGLCAMYLASNPGLKAAGHAMKAFLESHMDRCTPSGLFGRSGWSGNGAAAGEAYFLHPKNVRRTSKQRKKATAEKGKAAKSSSSSKGVCRRPAQSLSSSKIIVKRPAQKFSK